MNDINKVYLNGVSLEITRRCNLRCKHCLRGDAQNLTMSESVIDSLFSSISGTENVFITGGEPLLALGTIEYLISKLSAYDSCKYIEVATNGTIQDARIISLFGDFCNINPARKAKLTISIDSFHNVPRSHETYAYYHNLVKDNENITVDYQINTLKGQTIMPMVQLGGRAASLPIKKLKEKTLTISPAEATKHRIKLVGDSVYCLLYVSANGNICFPEDDSFSYCDSTAIGNVLTNNLHDIITEHNSNCLITCRESLNADQARRSRLIMQERYKEFAQREIHITFSGDYLTCYLYTVSNLIGAIMFERVMSLRKQAKALFPLIPAQEIIQQIPLPYCYRAYLLLNIKNIITEFESYSSDDSTVEQSLKMLYKGALNALSDCHLKDKVVMLYRLYSLLKSDYSGNTGPIWTYNDIRDTKAYDQLMQLSVDYEKGKTITNDAVLDCYNVRRKDLEADATLEVQMYDAVSDPALREAMRRQCAIEYYYKLQELNESE